MTVLHISPDSSALVYAAAAVVLYLHIGAGSVGLLSGAAALVFRKGSPLHRLAGKTFVVSMPIMSSIGASVAPFLPTPERASVLAGALTFNLVLTSWAASVSPDISFVVTTRRTPLQARAFELLKLNPARINSWNRRRREVVCARLWFSARR